uniref:Uncharacterized protein n=1 Tax=Corethron hystrix TaxID=216773 RepID=A0A7S1FKZ7_9STRA|mmetsp:Transcript_10313/g.22927  ORF Transcript_10313/g.22927 Transcript_10313/m.22927 type:complete len:239 (+) Transcript_10313:93-809(+)
MAPASRTIASPPSGQFNVDADCQFKCTVRKGYMIENPRGGASVEFKTKISEGLGVAKAKVLSFVQRTMDSAQLISEDLYFKKSKGASQSHYLKLTDDNFEDLTRSRWNLISARDVSSWSTEGKSVLEGFQFEVFIYVHRRPAENIPAGPITRQHVAISRARQTEGSECTMPNDNVTRQAQFLNEQREGLAREGEGGDDEERYRKKIRIELNGTWVNVRVDVRSLRMALGLLPHDQISL